MEGYTVEIILFVIIMLIVAGKPYSLMELGDSVLGKFILLVAVVFLALKSTIAGLLGALLLVVLSEGLREGMADKGKDGDKKAAKSGDDEKEGKEDKEKKIVKIHDAKVKESKDSKDKAEKKVKAELEKQVGKKTADKAIDDEKKEGAKESMADRLNITETMEKLQQLATATNKL